MNDLEKAVKRLQRYQDIPTFHPLTCIESYHEDLEPFINGDEVNLRCPTCGYIQKHLPFDVMDAEFDKFLDYHEAIMKDYLANSKSPAQ